MIKFTPKPKSEKKQKKGKKPVKQVSSRGILTKQAHAIIRDIVLDRDKGCVCPMPEHGHSSVRQAGHVIPSTKGGTRFDLWDINEQCSNCNGRHRYYEKYYNGWFVREFGEKAYLRLVEDSDKIGLKTYEIREIIVQLQLIRDRQMADPNFVPRFTQSEILSGSWVYKQQEILSVPGAWTWSMK